jgi:hypothetical protein
MLIVIAVLLALILIAVAPGLVWLLARGVFYVACAAVVLLVGLYAISEATWAGDADLRCRRGRGRRGPSDAFSVATSLERRRALG